MTKELVGVIVPVYKVEKYIAECIESILAQTYTNFRLILVDDGSPDNAGKICDEYAKKDTRITVIHQENAGVTRARARGVEEANDCEWISFVDGDDTIEKNFIEYLISHSSNFDSNIIISPADNYISPQNGVISALEYRHLLLRDVSLINSPWGKLIRKELFNENTFQIPKEIVVGEDLLMNIKFAFSNEKDIVVVLQNAYNYRIHPESTMRTYRRSTESEYLFYKQLRNIIPSSTWHNYVLYTIETRLSRFRNFCGYKYNAKKVFSSKFYKTLKKDIQECGYNIKGFEHILFYSNNIITRFIVINLKKCKNLIRTTIDNIWK